MSANKFDSTYLTLPLDSDDTTKVNIMTYKIYLRVKLAIIL